MTPNIQDLLRAVVQKGASDLHAKAGSPPGFRVDGNVVPQREYGVLTPDVTAQMAQQMMSPEQWQRFEKERDIDFWYAVKDLARFRVNTMFQRNTISLVARQIPDRIPDHKSLGLPQICLDLAAKPRGLVLVTGPTGSGKSTTLAAMIDFINQTESGHILTMEDPLEFIHRDKQCYITQRQIGQDCPNFREALRRAMRQDPDVILIGEMRDLETVGMAITAAETGHLVLGTLHTTSAISTVDRIVDVFPQEAQSQVRAQLAGTLQGVISQTLVSKTGGGRVAAREIMIATDAIRSLVREGKTAQILNVMQTSRAAGMVTLEDELLRLCLEGLISPEDCVSKSNRPEDVRRRLTEGQQRQGTAAATGSSVRTGQPTVGLGALGSAPGVGGLKTRPPGGR